MRISTNLNVAAIAFWAIYSFTFNQAFAQIPDAASRTALVFGNAAYSSPDRPLKNPVSDARLMARTLKELGFDVRLREDVDRRAMLQALREFEDTLRKTKGIGFLYFAGHGVQVNGRNYIVPVGANLVREVDALKNAIDTDAVLQSLRDTGAKLNIMVLDACRNNPLLATSRNAGGGSPAKAGLAPMRPPEGALVAFATEPGRLASDGNETGNGLYTKHLARWLKEPNLTLEQVFKRTREAVQLESKGEQIPTEYSVLTGADLYLAGLESKNAITPLMAALGSTRPATQGAPLSGRTGIPTRSLEGAAPPTAAMDTGTARVRLAQLGANYTKQSYQLALENDDLPVFELLIASGWNIEAWDVARLMDPRELPQYWPEKIMGYVAQNAKNWPVGEQLCERTQTSERFRTLVDVLRRGYDSPEMRGLTVLWPRENLDLFLKPRRAFYRSLCGNSALAQKSPGR